VTHPTVTATVTTSAPSTTTSAVAVIGLDVGDRRTHLCALSADQKVVRAYSFETSQPALAAALAAWSPSTRVVLEAGSQSPWMSRFVRELGFTPLVVDPRRVAGIARGQRKTDKRDAELLARLALAAPDLLGSVHHRSELDQALLSRIRSRATAVEARTRFVQSVRGQSKQAGVELPDCSTRAFPKKAARAIPNELKPALLPLLALIEQLSDAIDSYEKEIESAVREAHPEVDALREVPGVGPLVASTFVTTIGDPQRFAKSRHVGAWLGLAPKVRASGDRDPQLGISKTGCPYMRSLLLQSAHYILQRGPDCDLKRFGQRIASRGASAGKRRAATAVARKLAVLLHRLWVTGKPYQPLRATSSEISAA
jgi:transposase